MMEIQIGLLLLMKMHSNCLALEDRSYQEGTVKIIYINVNDELYLIQYKLLCKNSYFNVLIVIIEFY